MSSKDAAPGETPAQHAASDGSSQANAASADSRHAGAASGGSSQANAASRGSRHAGAASGRQTRRVGIAGRLFLAHVAILLIAAVVAFAASEAVTPLMMARHGRHIEHEGMGGRMGPRTPVRPDSGTERPMMSDVEAEYRSVTQQAMLLGLLAGLLVAAVASIFFTRRIAFPLRKMHDASGRIAEGRYGERLDESAPGEVGDLAAAFNRMAGELESTEARRSSLIGNVAHEFRTPLTSLQGYLEGLDDGHFTLDRDVLGACNRQVSRLRRLVDDLSLLSRVEAGVEPLEVRRCSVIPVLEQARDDLAARFEAKGVALYVDVRLGGADAAPANVDRPHTDAGATGEDLAFIDPDRTVQILENLLTNALRHTGPGGSVRVAAERRAGARIVVSVADTGEGIPEEALPHVFERFYRAEHSRSRSGEGDGAGIGLTVARAFAVAQGGDLRVSETSPRGTVFAFSLQAYDSDSGE